MVSALHTVILNGIRGEIDLGAGMLRSPSDVCVSLAKDYRLAPDSVSNTETDSFKPARLSRRLTAHWTPKTTKALFEEN